MLCLVNAPGGTIGTGPARSKEPAHKLATNNSNKLIIIINSTSTITSTSNSNSNSNSNNNK